MNNIRNISQKCTVKFLYIPTADSKSWLQVATVQHRRQTKLQMIRYKMYRRRWVAVMTTPKLLASIRSDHKYNSNNHAHWWRELEQTTEQTNSMCKQMHGNCTLCLSATTAQRSVSGHKNTGCAKLVHQSDPSATTHDKISQQSSRNSDTYTSLSNSRQLAGKGSCSSTQAANVHNWRQKAVVATVKQPVM